MKTGSGSNGILSSGGNRRDDEVEFDAFGKRTEGQNSWRGVMKGQCWHTKETLLPRFEFVVCTELKHTDWPPWNSLKPANHLWKGENNKGTGYFLGWPLFKHFPGTANWTWRCVCWVHPHGSGRESLYCYGKVRGRTYHYSQMTRSMILWIQTRSIDSASTSLFTRMNTIGAGIQTRLEDPI